MLSASGGGAVSNILIRNVDVVTLDDSGDDIGLSHKFFLWIVPQRNEK